MLTENMERKPVGNFEQPAESSLSRTDGQRSFLIPEVSHLITSVDRLTSHNFELLKMAKVPGNDIGKGHEIDLSELQLLIRF